MTPRKWKVAAVALLISGVALLGLGLMTSPQSSPDVHTQPVPSLWPDEPRYKVCYHNLIPLKCHLAYL